MYFTHLWVYLAKLQFVDKDSYPIFWVTERNPSGNAPCTRMLHAKCVRTRRKVALTTSQHCRRLVDSKGTEVPSMNPLELEQEIGKMTRAMMTRNTEIGDALISHLKTQLSDEEVAGVVLVSLERLIWFDGELFLWTLKNFIPADVVQEMRSITSVTIYKQLIGKKFIPGKDFSVDAEGTLLLNSQAKKAVFPNLKPEQLSGTVLTP